MELNTVDDIFIEEEKKEDIEEVNEEENQKEIVEEVCEKELVGFDLYKDCKNRYQYRSPTNVLVTVNHLYDDSIKNIKVTLTDYNYPGGVTFEFWGGGEVGSGDFSIHENLNGKHLKDVFHANRTMIFPDGVKVTIVSSSFKGVAEAVSIYDGEVAHRINLLEDKVEYSAKNKEVSIEMEENEIDGETSTFERTEKGLFYYLIYTEDKLGEKIEKKIDLGELEESDPKKVNDLFDDSRLKFT